MKREGIGLKSTMKLENSWKSQSLLQKQNISKSKIKSLTIAFKMKLVTLFVKLTAFLTAKMLQSLKNILFKWFAIDIITKKLVYRIFRI